MLPRRRSLLVALVAVALLAPAGIWTARASDPAPAATGMWGDFAPAFPGDIVVRQPDGSTFKGRLTNAEIGGAMEVDGYSVSKGDDGWWTYGTTSARVGIDKRPANLAPGLGRVPNVWKDAEGFDMRTQALRQLQIASYKASMQAAAAGKPRVFRFPVLMLATWWDDDKG